MRLSGVTAVILFTGRQLVAEVVRGQVVLDETQPARVLPRAADAPWAKPGQGHPLALQALFAEFEPVEAGVGGRTSQPVAWRSDDLGADVQLSPGLMAACGQGSTVRPCGKGPGGLGQSKDQGPCCSGRSARTMCRMDEESALRSSRYWRMSVWGFRTAVLAVAVVACSLVSVLTVDAGGWVLFGALCAIVASDIAIFSGFVLVRRNLPKPRPSFKRFRQTLGHNALHARS